MAPKKHRNLSTKSDKGETQKNQNEKNDDVPEESTSSVVTPSTLQSMLTSDEDFYKYENEIGSTTASFVGIVLKQSSSTPANNATVSHIVLGNNSEVEVQVTGWGPLSLQMDKTITGTQKVVWAQGLTVVESNQKSKYFFGNTKVSFKMTTNSEFEELGSVDKPIEELRAAKNKQTIIKEATFDNILNLKGSVRVRGFIRNPFKLYQWKYNNSISATLTDGRKILAVNVKTDQLPNHIHLGHEVEVVGFIEEDRENTHMLSVNSVDDIKLLSDRKLPFETIMFAHVHL